MILCLEGHGRIYLYQTLNFDGNGRNCIISQRSNGGKEISHYCAVSADICPLCRIIVQNTDIINISARRRRPCVAHPHPVCWFRRAGHTAAPVDDLLYQNNRKQNKDCLVSWRWNPSLGCNTTPPGTRIEAAQPQPPRLRFQNNTLWWSSYWFW